MSSAATGEALSDASVLPPLSLEQAARPRAAMTMPMPATEASCGIGS